MASREPRTPTKAPKTPATQLVGVNLSNELVQRLGRIQIRDGVTRTDLVRRVLTEFCDREDHA